MNSESLEALVLDRSFGELSPEAEELLAAYLELHPEAMREVEKIEASLSITKAAVTDQTCSASDCSARRFASRRQRGRTGVPTEFRREALRRCSSGCCDGGCSGWLYGRQSRRRESGYYLSLEEFPARDRFKNQPSRWAMPPPMPWAQYRLTASGLETVIANAPSRPLNSFP